MSKQEKTTSVQRSFFLKSFCCLCLDKCKLLVYNTNVCRRSLVVKPQLPKLMLRVRFPSPAPKQKPRPCGGAFLIFKKHFCIKRQGTGL